MIFFSKKKIRNFKKKSPNSNWKENKRFNKFNIFLVLFFEILGFFFYRKKLNVLLV